MMDNVRESIRNIKLLLNDHDLNGSREELVMELDHLEGIIDYLETKNHQIRERLEGVLKETKNDLDGDFEEVGDILY